MKGKLSYPGLLLVRWLLPVVLLFAFVGAPVPVVRAQGPVPAHHFWGKVSSLDGTSAGGLEVTAWIAGELRGSISTDQSGQYGSDPLIKLPYYLNVTGYSGDTIEFRVEGILADEVRFGTLAETDENRVWQWDDLEPEWQVSYEAGEVNGLDLVYDPSGSSITPPSGGGGGGGGGGGTTTSLTLKVELPGEISKSGKISQDGVVLETITISVPGMMSLVIPKDVKATQASGKPLESLKATLVSDPSSPSADNYIIAPAYDFQPNGARFNPSIRLTLNYDPAELPKDINPENLFIACYDNSELCWVPEQSIVNTRIFTVMTEITHFTQFVIIGSKSAKTTTTDVVPPPQADTVSEPDEDESATAAPAAQSAQEETASTGPAPPAASESTESGTVNWFWIAVIAGSVVVIGIVAYILRRLFSYP